MDALNAPGVYYKEIDYSGNTGRIVTGTVGACIHEGAKGLANVPVRYNRSNVTEQLGVKNFKKFGFSQYALEHYLQEAPCWSIRAVDPATARTAIAFCTVDDTDAAVPTFQLVNRDDGSHNPQGMLGDPATFVFNASNPAHLLMPFIIYAVGPSAETPTVVIRHSAPVGSAAGQHSDPYRFYVDVYADEYTSTTQPTESFLCSRKKEIDSYGQQLYLDDRLKSSNYIRGKNNPLCPDVQVLSTFFEMLDGGAVGNRPSAATIAALWDKYSDTDAFDCKTAIAAGYTSSAVVTAMNEVCAKTGSMLPIFDMPDSTFNGYLSWRNAQSPIDSFGAFIASQALVKDPATLRNTWMPMSGIYGAVLAINDRLRNAGHAAMGTVRGALPSYVLDVKHHFDRDELTALDQSGINVVRRQDGALCIMSNLTSQLKDTGLRRLHKRRMMNEIRAAVRVEAIRVNFNPLDEFERTTLVNIVQAILRKYVASGAIQDHLIVCNDSNNTTETTIAKDMYMHVVVDGADPTEKVHITANLYNLANYVEF